MKRKFILPPASTDLFGRNNFRFCLLSFKLKERKIIPFKVETKAALTGDETNFRFI